MPAIENLTGARVTVMGLGQFGGGLGAVQYLLNRGAQVTVTDFRTAEQLQNSLAEIDLSQLAGLTLGEHREADFTDCDFIVVNPAVRRSGNRFLDLAAAHQIPLTSEINLFWERCPAKKIVVTGSVGKSTTATLIYQSLLAAGRKARLGGNIGISLLPVVDEITAEEWVVLELSSFQLADLDRQQPQPDLAVVTNFFPNHLDWHGTLDHYREAKQSALCWQTPDQIAVLNGDDADSALWPTDARVVWFGHEVWQDRPGVHISDRGISVRSAAGGWLVAPEDLSPSLQTKHGMQNAAAALAALAVGLELPIDSMANTLRTFESLPHRFELVAEIDGRRFINDSKATTPEATIAALRSLSAPVHLIAGGKDKGVELDELAQVIAERAKTVWLIGDTAEPLKSKLTAFPARKSSAAEAFAHVVTSLEAAVEAAWLASAPGDVILLSPACASDRPFANYEERGAAFVKCVEAISGA